MDIRKPKELKTFAAQRLQNTREEKQIVAIYAGISVAMVALVGIISYCLDLQIEQSGGLGKLGMRSFLSTIQTMLPIGQMLVLLCLDLGYLAAMLRIARGQYVSPQTLKLGLDRFWPLLRCTLLQSFVYIGISIASLYIAVMIFVMTPLGSTAIELLTPLLLEANGAELVLDDVTYYQLTSSMVPAWILFAVLFCVLAVPVSYQFRMANYVLIDKPGTGARFALKESRNMMKHNKFLLFRIDLSMWWYYAAMAVASVVCYGDQLLFLLGVELPWSDTVGYFLFYGLYLVLEFAIYYFIRNRVEVTYALVYDSIKPVEKQDKGVVLGNIFQM